MLKMADHLALNLRTAYRASGGADSSDVARNQMAARLLSTRSKRDALNNKKFPTGRVALHRAGAMADMQTLSNPRLNQVRLNQLQQFSSRPDIPSTSSEKVTRAASDISSAQNLAIKETASQQGASKSGGEAFRAFLNSNHALGAGIPSSLGLMMCYGYQARSQKASGSGDADGYDLDDYDEYDEDEIDTQYHLKYQLNSIAYDAVSGGERPMNAFEGGEAALMRYLFEDDPRYISAQNALIQHDDMPMPKPEDYGLYLSDVVQNVVKNGAFDQFGVGYQLNGSHQRSTVHVPDLSALQYEKNTVPDAKGGANAPLTHPLPAGRQAEWLTQQHRAYQADYKRVQKSNFERRLNSQIVAFQHRCILKNIPWIEAMPLAKAHIGKTLLKTDPYAQSHRMLAHAAMSAGLKRVNYSVHEHGARFKAHKNSDSPLADHTQIRTASGKVYALLNELDEADSKALLEQHGIAKSGSLVLGEGMFGKVRLAQDMETGKIVAVKKMFSRHMANLEIEEFGVIPPDDHLVSLFDYAHVRTSDGDNKSYLFMEMVGDVNGDALVKALAARRKQGIWGRQHKLLNQAVLECSIAVIKLHELGMFHCDIKPENFIISHKAIHLGDYGLSTKDRYSHPGSTLAYNPRDEKYDAEKHDAYSLGITFYEFMHGKHPDDLGESPKTQNSDKLLGKTLEECVAKLRDEDPEKRITVHEFVRLPYIQKLMSRQQRAAARDLVLMTEAPKPFRVADEQGAPG